MQQNGLLVTKVYRRNPKQKNTASAITALCNSFHAIFLAH